MAFYAFYTDQTALERMTDGLGKVWEIAKNTYKPYPAGIVLHPVIEACIKLHNDLGLRSEDVAKVELSGHPLLRQRTDRPDVTTGRLSQVCAQHAIAIALRRGKAGILEFNDDAVTETLRDGIRPNITFVDDESRAIEFVHMRVQTRQGANARHRGCGSQRWTNKPDDGWRHRRQACRTCSLSQLHA